MERLEKLITNTVFFLLCLLAILLLFEEYVEIPFWLQPLGRMHPLVLHFPIGFVVLLVLANLFKSQLDEESYQKVNKFLLLLTTLSTALAAIMGFFLSLEEGYTSDLMSLHKWIGAAVSYVMYALILVQHNERVYRVLLYSGFFAIVFAGHFGAGLTHGMNFLTEPIFKNEKKKYDENTPVFEAYIRPILESKCQNCHNAEKHKGQLDISTLEKLHKGGENGPVWVEGNVEESEIIRRALLSIEDDDHMPPKGKAQLSGDELALISEWIKQGADEVQPIGQLKEQDSLYLLAQKVMAKENEGGEPEYAFDFADEELVASLNNPYRTVQQKSPSSPAIDVAIFGRKAFTMEYIEDLVKIKEQLSSLNLSYLPIEDDIFEKVSQFSNLEKLILNFTNINGDGIEALNSCENLKYLSLSGTGITTDAVKTALDKLKLEELYVWGTSMKNDELNDLTEAYPAVSIVTGYDSNSEEELVLNAPSLRKKGRIITSVEKVEIVHKLNGVEIRYTDDGSEPDSLSKVFENPLYFHHSVVLKAKSYKDGWIPSEVVTFKLTQRGEVPESVKLLTAPTGDYKAKLGYSLTDDEQGNIKELPNLSWLGYQETNFEAIADFGDNPPTLEKLLISTGVRSRQRAYAPEFIKVLVGDDKENLRLLKTERPKRKEDDPGSEVVLYPVELGAVQYRYYHIIAKPTDKLPEWHSKKDEKGRLFIDQLFFYPPDQLASQAK
ncbi:MAG: chitobiase/beta-hexosaminidase C-terminal domain-containing protein [Cyclobacteriaceae bacterium]